MTLVDRPLIQYAIEEARESGIEEFIFVTSRGKSALEDYFDESPVLEASLEAKDKDELLDILRSTNMPSGQIAYIRQHQARGLGLAAWCDHRLIAPNESFAVILPDDVISSDASCLKQMVDAHEQTGGSLVAAMEVPQDKTSAYGVLDVKEDMGALVSAKRMVEKPKTEEAPSNLAVIGRYILSPDVFINLEKTEAGSGGEIQLTDAIAQEITEGRDVYGYRFQGERFDCGCNVGFLQATVAFVLDRPDLRDELHGFLHERLSYFRQSSIE